MPVTTREKWYIGIIATTALVGGAMWFHPGRPAPELNRTESVPKQAPWPERYQTLLAGIFAATGGGLACFGAVRSARILHQSETEKQKRDHERGDRLHRDEHRNRRKQAVSFGIAYSAHIHRMCDQRIEMAKAHLASTNTLTPVISFISAIESMCFGITRIEDIPTLSRRIEEFNENEIHLIIEIQNIIKEIQEYGSRYVSIMKNENKEEILSDYDALAINNIKETISSLRDTIRLAEGLGAELARDR